MRNIVIPVDESDDCTRSITWVVNNLYKEGDGVFLLHVLPLAPPVDLMAGLGGVDGLVTVSAPPASAEEEKQEVVVERQRKGEMIGDVIARFAGDVDAAALVMASHKKSKLQELIMGSVSKHAANHSNTATIILH